MGSTGAALGLMLLAFGCARTPLDDAPAMTSTANGGATGGGGGSGGAWTCGDTQSDVANCGACGVRCNGDCQSGRCVITLASGLQEVGCVAVDGASVYWVEGLPGPDFQGAVMKAPIDGGSVTTLASGNGFPWPCHIALDQTNVYWGGADAVGVRKVPLGGGAMTTIAATGSAAGGLAVDATSAYFSSDFDGVFKVPLAGGALEPVGVPGGVDLAIDSGHVYWAVRTGAQTTDLLFATLEGGANQPLASSLPQVQALAVDSTDVYVVEYGAGQVQAIPITGGPTRTVTSDLFIPSVIALDDQNVYVSTVGSVARVPKTGGTSTVLAVDTNIFSLAVDASSVYWTNGEAVKKVSKR
jgi:hypothetical protein